MNAVSSNRHNDDDAAGAGYPGDLLGLPAEGPGAMAPFGRRVLALLIDWAIATLISLTWFNADPWVTLGIFVFMHVALVGLLGVTIGKRLVRIQVVRLRPNKPASIPGPHWALVRVVFILLVLPPIIMAPDGRGAHDRIAGTVEVIM